MTGLSARVGVALGDLRLDVGLEVPPGTTVALLGPNGAGKTTLLRALAGLQPLDTGHVTLDGAALDDPASGRWVAPERRSVGFVFQHQLLFPHLDAAANVAFGLRARGVPRAHARRRALEWLARVDLADRARARPAQLSGGQAQRVALARALATEPRLLLLDEPLSALDATTRVRTRRDLRRHLDEHDGVRVVVTHDPLEAASLADLLVVVEDGSEVQRGTLTELTAAPRSAYVADLAGVNLLRGRAAGTVITTSGGGTLHCVEPLEGEVLVAVHPRAVALHAELPHGTPRNVWAAVVEGVDPEAGRVRVLLGPPLPLVAEITAAAADELGIVPGSAVWASVKATELVVQPA